MSVIVNMVVLLPNIIVRTTMKNVQDKLYIRPFLFSCRAGYATIYCRGLTWLEQRKGEDWRSSSSRSSLWLSDPLCTWPKRIDQASGADRFVVQEVEVLTPTETPSPCFDSGRLHRREIVPPGFHTISDAPVLSVSIIKDRDMTVRQIKNF